MLMLMKLTGIKGKVWIRLRNDPPGSRLSSPANVFFWYYSWSISLHVLREVKVLALRAIYIAHWLRIERWRSGTTA